MKHIYTHEELLVLHSVKNILTRHGVDSFVKNEHVAPMSARHGISNMFHELWVYNDEDYTKASTIIENEVENPEPKVSWHCAGCDEDNDGSFEVCWKCENPPAEI